MIKKLYIMPLWKCQSQAHPHCHHDNVMVTYNGAKNIIDNIMNLYSKLKGKVETDSYFKGFPFCVFFLLAVLNHIF